MMAGAVVIGVILAALGLVYLAIAATLAYSLARQALQDAAAPLSISAPSLPDLELRDGDIIFFSRHDAAVTSRTISGLFGTPFFHVAVVILRDSRPMLLHYVEPVPEGLQRYEPQALCPPGLGPSVSDLAAVLANVGPGTLLGVLRTRQEEYGADIVDAAIRVACPGGRGLPYDGAYEVSYLWSFIAPSQTAAKLQCNSFVGLLMEALGVLKKRSEPDPTRAYTPDKLLRALVNSGNFYAPPTGRPRGGVLASYLLVP